jgi:hypothetical protein
MITYVEALACTGTPAEVAARSQALCSEAIAAGDYVTVYNVGGVATCRRAIATDEAHLANGFVLGALASGQWATVYGFGANDAVTGQVPGVVYLSGTVPGKGTSVEPTIAQQLGFALHGALVVFQRQNRGGSTSFGREGTLFECVYAGLTPQTFTSGVPATLNGLTHGFLIPSGGAAAIVAGGLKVTGGSGAETFANMIDPAALRSIIVPARYRRGRWAYWMKLGSTDFSANSYCHAYWGVVNDYPYWGHYDSRSRGVRGGNTASAGSLQFAHWFNGSQPGSDTFITDAAADVVCMYFRSPFEVDHYYGGWAGGWPSLDSMAYGGSTSMQSYVPSVGAASTRDILSGSLVLLHQAYNSAIQTYERWRLTSYD